MYANKNIGPNRILFISLFFFLLISLLFSQSTSVQSYPRLEINELYLFKDTYLISYKVNPGTFLLYSDDFFKKCQKTSRDVDCGLYRIVYPHHHSFFTIGSGSFSIDEKDSEKISSADLKQLLNKQVTFVLMNGSNVEGILSNLPSENNGQLYILYDIKLNEFRFLPLTAILSIKPNDISYLNNESYYTITISGKLDKLIAIPPYYTYKSYSCVYCDNMNDNYYLVNVLDVDKKQIHSSVSFVNIFGKFNNSKVSIFSYGLNKYSLNNNYDYYYYGKTASSTGFSADTSTSSSVVMPVESESVYTITIPDSDFGKVHSSVIAKDNVDLKEKVYVWEANRENNVYEYLNVKTKSVTIPHGYLLVMKNNLPYARVYTKQIYDKEYSEIKLKQDNSIVVSRKYSTKSDYDYTGKITSYDYTVELTLLNNGREKKTISVREYITSSYYYSSSQYSYPYQVLSVEGISEYKKEVDRISFDVTLNPGEKKTITLRYRTFV